MTIEGTTTIAKTSRDGTYRVAQAAVGASLIIDKDGFETALGMVSGAEVDDIVLLSLAQASETIEIHGDAAPASPGSVTVSRDDIQRIPGSGGDVVRALTAMPGVVNTQMPAGYSGLVIRGSAPQDSKVLIDDFEVPLLYHTIGFRAILPAEAISTLDYVPGGFDVAYGRAASGIVSLTTRAGSEKRSEQAEISALDGGALAQGSFRHTDYMLAVRRSTIDMILPYVLPASANLSLTTVPYYYDLQGRIDHALSSKWKLAVSTIGSIDAFQLYFDKTHQADKQLSQLTEFVRVTASARWQDGPWSAVLALSEMPESFNVSLGAVQHIHVDRIETTLRGELTRTAKELGGLTNVTWRVGGEVDASRYALDLAVPTPKHDGTAGIGGLGMGMGLRNPNDVSFRFQGVIWTPDFGSWTALSASLSPRVHVTTGLRLDGFARSGQVTLQPRGQLILDLTSKLGARLAAGAYRRPAEYQDELIHNLDPERSTQVIAGLEYKPRDGVRIQPSLYYTDRSHLVAADPTGTLGNTGRGTTYGAEVLATVREGPWFGWLSYSYTHSTRIDYPGGPTYLFAYDQPHSLNGALSWKKGNWQLGARFELYSGLPYTPIASSVFQSDSNTYDPTNGAVNSLRVPLHHQLDFRIDHTWQVGPVALTGFLDIQNAYLNASVSTYQYNYDYSQKSAITSLPIIPSIGLRGVL
ncbi:MAG: TonB family protein / TonB-dependent receptor [Myxococcales bacterium]|nr:TonB family protein / TonB-dependent receptor [Myxococcales bacterium]